MFEKILSSMTARMAEREPSGGSDARAMSFILVTAFLGTMGIGIIAPLVPFLTQPYIGRQDDLAAICGLLISAYAICQFVATPLLGALSERFGRRLLLLICLLGSVAGYILLGVGGALWILFLGRIIDGLTGGNANTLYTYVADSVDPRERGQYFAMLGAAFGLGFMIGPVIGGLAAGFGYQVPLFAAAAITLANAVWGYFMLPESLPVQRRARRITLSQLNPFEHLNQVSLLPQLHSLLLATFLFALPFAAFQVTTAVLLKDSLGWPAAGIGVLFFVAGVVDIVAQGAILRYLTPLVGEVRLSIAGLICAMLGYLLLSLVAFWASLVPLLVGTIFFAFGDALVQPTVSRLLTQAAGPRDQGYVHGGNQSVQALARVIGPFAGGILYSLFGHAVPYWMSAIASGLAILAVCLSLPTLRAVFGLHSQDS